MTENPIPPLKCSLDYYKIIKVDDIVETESGDKFRCVKIGMPYFKYVKWFKVENGNPIYGTGERILIDTTAITRITRRVVVDGVEKEVKIWER